MLPSQVELKAGALTLRGLDFGGNGPLYVGLHGFLDNANSFMPLAEYLGIGRFVALDLAGHGCSDHRAQGAHYHQMDYLQDLYELFVEQQWHDAIMVGHSMGGILATLFAAAFPEYVRAVVSIDACGPLTKPASTSAEQLTASIKSRVAKPQARRRIVDFDQVVAARCNVSDISPRHAKSIMSRNLCQVAGGWEWRSDARLRTKSTLRLTEAQAEALMREIACPILFVSADKSFKQVDEVYAQRRCWFKHSQIAQFAGGHHIHMEQPQGVGAAIRQFVEQL